jgi:aquaporin Z
MQQHVRILAAEAVGTFILLVGGPGSAVLAAEYIGILGVALAFGLALLVAVYAIGPISGCHINPAVTLGLVLARKTCANQVPAYLGGQVIGAVLGGLVVLLIAKGRQGGFDAEPETFATNLWGHNYGFYSFGSMVLVEILLTAVLVYVVLSSFHHRFSAGAAGLAIGLVLTLIHLVSIPVDNTSVNPIRSLGMAVFAGGDALEQLWAFIVFPLIGGAVGFGVWLLVDESAAAQRQLASADAPVPPEHA